MLSFTGLNHFYYVRSFVDMLCKYSRVVSIICECLHRKTCDSEFLLSCH